MKILCCGDRNWSNSKRLNAFLNEADARASISLVIEGEARGADTLGRLWAESKKIPVEPHPANWGKFGRSAGPIRNREMLKSKPDLVVAFHHNIKESKGTLDMVKASMKAGIPVIIVTDTTHRYIDSVKIFVEGIDVDKYIMEA